MRATGTMEEHVNRGSRLRHSLDTSYGLLQISGMVY